MSIETICQNCARKLRVDDEFAGRKARCPHCKNVYTVPQSAGSDAFDSMRSKQSRDESEVFPALSGDQWRLRTEDGNVYGPVGKTELDSWLAEGRITTDCQLQREGSSEWMPAATIYPALVKAAAQPVRSGANPFADGATPNSNPYSAPRSAHPVVRSRHHKPHRGGTILALGIVGIACCVICAPIAWVMGQADLSEIRTGRMDPAGRSLTQAGMVLGIIGTLILAVQVIFGVIGLLAN